MQLRNILFSAVFLVLGVDLISALYRIMGGEDTEIQDQPWAVSLQWQGKHFCGGVIISSRTILTAAHCLYRKKLSKRLKVLAGTKNSSDTKSGTLVGVKRALVHALYDNKTYDYDIAVVKTDKRFNYTDRIKSIKLAEEGYNLSPGDRLTLSGWGVLKPHLKRSNPILQSVVVNFIDWQQCKNLLSRINLFSTRMICAGVPAGGKDTCKGDSGGPMEANGTLFGITSWGSGCGNANLPGAYSSISYFRRWIRKHCNV